MVASARLFGRDFLLLCQGQTVSTVGDAAYRVALGFWVLEHTGSTALMGAVMAASLLPKVVLGPWAGALADRRSRRALLVASDFGAGVASLAVGLAAWAGWLSAPLLLVATLVLGAAAAVFEPALLAALPELVPPSRLGQGNSVLSVAYAGATIAGSALGGVAYASLGAPLLFVGNGASFVYSGLSLLLLRAASDHPASAKRSLTGAVVDAIAWVGRHRGLRALLASAALAHLGVSAALLLVLAHSEQQATLGAAGYGAAMAGLSTGALLGFVGGSARELPARLRPAAFVLAGVVQAAALAAFGWTGSLWLGAMLGAVAGLGMSLESTVLATALQLAVEPATRGRVFALRATLLTTVGLVANLSAGLLAERLTAQLLLGIAAGVILLGMMLVAASPGARQILATAVRAAPA